MSRWFRAYDDALDDPKVQLLPDNLFRAWFNLMCVTSKNKGKPFTVEEISFRLRVGPSKANEVANELVNRGLLDESDGRYISHNWGRRQFKSDVSNERVERHRKRSSNAECNVTGNSDAHDNVTPPERTDTDTDTEKKESKRRRATRLPENWGLGGLDLAYAISKGLRLLEIETEAEKFKNYWTAKSGHTATKTDWSATWRNWILNALERKGKPNGTGRKTLGDLAMEIADEAREREIAAGIVRAVDPVGSD
jgi:hypothetical protein